MAPPPAQAAPIDQLSGYLLFYASCQLFYALVYLDFVAVTNFCLAEAACMEFDFDAINWPSQSVI